VTDATGADAGGARVGIDRRRAALAAIALVLVAAAVAAFLLWPRPSPLDAVPAEADTVGHVDIDRMTATGTRTEVTMAAFAFQSTNRYYVGPRFERHLAPFRNASTLALADASEATLFASLPDGNASQGIDPAYRGMVVTADWSPEAVVAAVERERNVTLRPDRRRGRTVYVPASGERTDPHVAVLDDGRYAVGTGSAVDDAVAVAAGDAPPVDGRLREAFHDAPEGYVTFAAPFPTGRVPPLPFVDTSGLLRIRTVTGVYYAEDDRLGLDLRLTTDDASSAESVAGVVDLGLAVYADRTDSDLVATELGKANVTHRGRQAVLVYESRPERVRALLEVL